MASDPQKNWNLPFSPQSYKTVAKDFIDFLNETGSPYHSVAAAIKRILKPNGFVRIGQSETDWANVRRGGKYYTTRNGATLFAARVGRNFTMSRGRIVLAVAHTDSPCLRLWPKANNVQDPLVTLGAAPYGGGLWHTWVDRGLAIAGKLILKHDHGIVEKLVKIDRPIAIIPSLPPHLQNMDERLAWKVNKETQMKPVLLSGDSGSVFGDQPTPESCTIDQKKLQPLLVAELLSNCGAAPTSEIVDFDLCLLDATPARILGLKEEFIESGRLDNLVSTYAVFQALVVDKDNNSNLAAHASEKVNSAEISEDDLHVSIAFDHEEIGSVSTAGADSNAVYFWLRSLLKCVVEDCESDTAFEALWNPLMDRSFLVSIDVAHAFNPNFPDKYQSDHKCHMHRGVVIKYNANQRYATTPTTASVIDRIGEALDVPVQRFIVRNDTPCGSTVGPSLSARLGVRTVDIGTPIWAMHSARECCGASDVLHLIVMVFGLFAKWGEFQSDMVLIDDS